MRTSRLRIALVALAVLASAGCWRPVAIARAAAERGEEAVRGAASADYAKLPVGRGRRLVVAHRGYSAAAPENTLSALHAAIAAGADAVEFDVRLTRDGRAVLMHDATVDRTTDGHGRLRALSFERVRRLDAARQWWPRFRGERVPTLEEALSASRGKALAVVELKEPDQRLARQAVQAIAALDMQAEALVISFHERAIARVRALDPRIPIGRLAYPLDPPGRRACEVRADVALGFFGALDRRAVATAHAAGLSVFTWTVNDPAAMRRVAAWGVDGIITDDPLRARQVLAGP